MSLLLLLACTGSTSAPTDSKGGEESQAPPVDADGDGWDEGVDCDDADAAVNPAATESCNGKDDDCDGEVDPASSTDAATWYADADGDHYGDPSHAQGACDTPAGYVADDTDCDDGDAAVHPGATESCNGVDDDCDDDVDPDDAVGAIPVYTDGDGDGWGAEEAGSACVAPVGTSEQDGDCDDAEAAVNPEAVERCNDLDDDCDGAVDPADAAGATSWYPDVDGDSHGDADLATTACDAPAGNVATGDDCDDGDAAIHPGAAESCNSLDDDCDGVVDPPESDGATTWYADDDGDGYGNPSKVQVSCAAGGWLSDATDCDDSRADVHPGAIEACDAADVDEDCDGLLDDADPDVTGLLDVYVDVDGDGSPGTAARACDGATSAADCDDGDIVVFPGAVETCDGKDDDCDGATDEGSIGDTWYRDVDGDGYGVVTDTVLGCVAPAGYVDVATDCDDGSDSVHPGATELCWDSVDQDCDGSITVDRDCAPVGAVGSDAVLYGESTSLGLGAALAAEGSLLVVSAAPSGSSGGAVYGLYPGSSGSWTTSTVSFTITGGSGERFGAALAFAGGKLLVGATGAEAVYVLDTTATSSAGAVAWTGEGAGGALAASDGEVLVGASGYDRFGAVDAGGAWLLDAADIATGGALDDGVALLRGEQPGDAAGSFVAIVGDTDGDGVDDFAIGAPENDRGGDGAGRAWLVLGPVSGVVDLAGEQISFVGAAGDSMGPVAGPGDVDADGYADLVIGAPDADPSGRPLAGEVLLYTGPVSPGVHAAGDATARLQGAASSAALGTAVAGGDVDADGYADVWAGAPGSSQALLWYGPIDGTLTTSDATLTGSSGDQTGTVLLGSIDVDEDGYADLAAAAPGYDGSSATNAGAVRVVLGGSRGSTTVSPVVPDPDDDLDGDGHTEATGDCDDTRATRAPGLPEVCGDALDEDCDGLAAPCAPSGTTTLATARLGGWIGLASSSLTDELTVVPAGDFNGDGWPDVLVGDYAYGTACVELGPVPGGTRSWTYGDVCYAQEAKSDYVGSSIAGVGDMNGDGYDDIAVGATGNDTGGSSAGRLYVIFGGPDPVGGSLADADVILTGDAASDGVGGSAEGVGDTDGDGLADMVFLAYPDGLETVFLLRGADLGTASSLADTVAWAPAELDGTYFGSELQRAGDLDGDGVDELLIGAYYLGGRGDASGAAYVLWGGLTEPGQDVRTAATTIEGAACSSVCEHAGRGLNGRGDMNGDGYADLVVGAWGADSSHGAIYVFFGPIPRVGDLRVEEADVVITGGADGDRAGWAVDNGGDLDHDGYDDLVIGAYGYDGSSYGSGIGRVYVFYGPIDAGTWSVNTADALLSGSSYEGVGSQLHAGVDYDLDGYGDLLVGVTKDSGSGTATASIVRGGLRDGTWTEPHVVRGDDDRDGDGWTVDAGDCDDTDATVSPAGVEACWDGADNDCALGDAPCFATGIVETRDWRKSDIARFDTHYYWGLTLVGVPDLDGDGRDELLIGDRGGDGTVAGTGVGLLYRGPIPRGEWDADDRWPETSFDGEASNDGAGYAMADLGDVDGDGLRDLAIGAYANDYNGTSSGSAYLILGAELDLGHVDLARADARLYGASADGYFGITTCGPGDIDGDGLDEVLVGASGDDTVASGAGAAFLWSGGAYSGNISAADADWSFWGELSNDAAGACARVGDLDGDGAADVVLGAEGYDGGIGADGRVYVFYGGLASGSAPMATADAIVTGSTGIGEVIVGPGDTDHDGRADLLLGAAGADTAGSNAGAVYWWSGSPGSNATEADADATWLGAVAGDDLGYAIGSGDYDGDGSTDLALGGPHETGSGSYYGAIYVFWGGAGWSGTATATTADVTFDGDPYGYWNTGAALVSDVDLNGDGFDDLVETTHDDYVIVLYGGMR